MLEIKPFFSHTHETRFLWFPFYFLSYFLLLNAKHALNLQKWPHETHPHTLVLLLNTFFLFISFNRRYATFNYTYFTLKKKSTQKYATLAKMKINELFRSTIRYSLNLRSQVIVIHANLPILFLILVSKIVITMLSLCLSLYIICISLSLSLCAVARALCD